MTSYGGAVASVVRRLKYGKRPDLGPPVGELLAEMCSRRLQQLQFEVDVVVPVPVPYPRLVQRGYNQAALLARPVARRLSAAFAPTALRRKSHGKRQAELGRKERLKNLEGTIRVANASSVRNRTVLLIDDVTTTGATLDVCADVLMQAGASRVIGAVFARTPKES